MPERLDHRLPCRGRVDNCMQFFRRGFLRRSGPDGPQSAGEFPFPRVPGEDEDFRVREEPADGHQNQMARGAETGEAEIPAVGKTGETERPVADRARTEQRGRLLIAEDPGDGVGKGRGDGHELRVPAVNIAARCAKLRAEVLVPKTAGVARAAGPVDPAHTDAISRTETSGVRSRGGDAPDDLMSQDDWKDRRRGPPLDLVQLRVADAADRDGNQQFTLAGDRRRDLRRDQRLRIFRKTGNAVQNHRFHGLPFPLRDRGDQCRRS